MTPDNSKQAPKQSYAPLPKLTPQIPVEQAPAEEVKRGSLFGRFNAKVQDAIQTGRADTPARDDAPKHDDLALKKPKNAKAQRMVVPEGVVIEGSLNSLSETEISGTVEGDVTVDGKLLLGETGKINGNVRTTTAKIEGQVQGKFECTQDLEIELSGKLNNDVLSGKAMSVSGAINGNVTCGGLLRLAASANVTGNIRARSLVIEEGAVFNGHCSAASGTKEQLG